MTEKNNVELRVDGGMTTDELDVLKGFFEKRGYEISTDGHMTVASRPDLISRKDFLDAGVTNGVARNLAGNALVAFSELSMMSSRRFNNTSKIRLDFPGRIYSDTEGRNFTFNTKQVVAETLVPAIEWGEEHIESEWMLTPQSLAVWEYVAKDLL